MKTRIFISYSVESDEHNEKVKRFARQLQNQQMEVFLFDDMSLGERFGYFMENIERCEFVLFICTPEYKKRADEREGGVGYEWNIITSSVVRQTDEWKFIPVLFEGDWNKSLPIWARGKRGLDYRNESDKEFTYLIENIRNVLQQRDRRKDLL